MARKQSADNAEEIFLIECIGCEATVETVVRGLYSRPDDDGAPIRYVFLQCKQCGNPSVGIQEVEYITSSGVMWSNPQRIWPVSEREIPKGMPEIVQASLEEAERCFRARATLACAVMCGRALEAVCLHFKTSSTNLGRGLKELKDKQIIDERLFTWGEELRQLRNVAAHATDIKVSKQDAEDILNFALAICEYVFVLTERFNQFQSRKKSATKKDK